MNGCPVKLLDTMPKISRPAPALGQDNELVYSALGYTDEQLREFKEKGVI